MEVALRSGVYSVPDLDPVLELGPGSSLVLAEWDAQVVAVRPRGVWPPNLDLYTFGGQRIGNLTDAASLLPLGRGLVAYVENGLTLRRLPRGWKLQLLEGVREVRDLSLTCDGRTLRCVVDGSARAFQLDTDAGRISASSEPLGSTGDPVGGPWHPHADILVEARATPLARTRIVSIEGETLLEVPGEVHGWCAEGHGLVTLRKTSGKHLLQVWRARRSPSPCSPARGPDAAGH